MTKLDGNVELVVVERRDGVDRRRNPDLPRIVWKDTRQAIINGCITGLWLSSFIIVAFVGYVINGSM